MTSIRDHGKSLRDPPAIVPVLDFAIEPPMLRLPKTPLRNLHTQIAERIGACIVAGEIGPGRPLPSEMALCEMLGASRTAVREAIRVLAGKGLVESRAKSGTRVRPAEQWSHFDPDVLRWQLASARLDEYLPKLFALRHAVEPAAAGLAAAAATAEDKRCIREALEAMETAGTNDDYVRGDIAFHKSIFIATRNEFFWPIAQMLEVMLQPSFEIAAPGDHRRRALAEHRDVMEAIVAGKSAKATRATLLLLDNSAKDLARIRNK